MVPVTVIFSQTLALDLMPLDEVLVHELAHAVLGRELGLRYDRLPPWVHEGISCGLAGQWEGIARSLLVHELITDPQLFVEAAFPSRMQIDLEGDACGRGAPTAGLALWCLEKEGSDRALRALVAALYAGLTIDEALRAVCGKGTEEFLALAGQELRRRLEARWEAMVPVVKEVLRAEELATSRGYGVVVKTCDEALAGGVPDEALGFVLWRKAKALELSGRLEEALAIHSRILAEPLARPNYREGTRVGRAWCLLALECWEAARRELVALRRDALDVTIQEWADQRLVELDQAADRR